MENPRAVGATFNVVDGHEISIWNYLGEYLHRTGSREYRIPVPYGLALTLVAALADWINRRLCQGKVETPGPPDSMPVSGPISSRCDSAPASYRRSLGMASPPLVLPVECLDAAYLRQPTRLRDLTPAVKTAPRGFH